MGYPLANGNVQDVFSPEKEPPSISRAMKNAIGRRLLRRQDLASLFTLIDKNGLPTLDMSLPRMTREPRRQWYAMHKEEQVGFPDDCCLPVQGTIYFRISLVLLYHFNPFIVCSSSVGAL